MLIWPLRSSIQPGPWTFAKALLKRSKTDAMTRKAWPNSPPRLSLTLDATTSSPKRLQQRLVHRDALVDARHPIRNQLHALERQPGSSRAYKRGLRELIATLTEQIAGASRRSAQHSIRTQHGQRPDAYIPVSKGWGR